MFCSEWWASEIFTLFSGIIGVRELAVMTIVNSVNYFLFQVALGLQEAASSLIGNCIGAGNVVLAKRFYRLMLKSSLIIAAVNSALLFFLRKPIINMFSDE